MLQRNIEFFEKLIIHALSPGDLSDREQRDFVIALMNVICAVAAAASLNHDDFERKKDRIKSVFDATLDDFQHVGEYNVQ